MEQLKQPKDLNEKNYPVLGVRARDAHQKTQQSLFQKTYCSICSKQSKKLIINKLLLEHLKRIICSQLFHLFQPIIEMHYSLRYDTHLAPEREEIEDYIQALYLLSMAARLRRVQSWKTTAEKLPNYKKSIGKYQMDASNLIEKLITNSDRKELQAICSKNGIQAGFWADHYYGEHIITN